MWVKYDATKFQLPYLFDGNYKNNQIKGKKVSL